MRNFLLIKVFTFHCVFFALSGNIDFLAPVTQNGESYNPKSSKSPSGISNYTTTFFPELTNTSAFNGKRFWNFVSSLKTPPCIVGIFQGNRSQGVKNMAGWDVQMPWELNLPVSIYVFKGDDFQDFKRLLQVMKTQCSDIHFLLFVTTETLTRILKQVKQERMENNIQTWILQDHLNVKNLASRSATGFKIRLLKNQSRGISSLSTIKVYNTYEENGITVKKKPLVIWKEDTIRKVTSAPDLGGRILKIAVLDSDPFIRMSNVNGNITVSGIEANLLNSMSQSFNFRYQIVIPEDGLYGSPTPNGSVRGLIGMVAREEVDLSMCSITITGERSTVVQFSYPYYFEPVVILSLAPKMVRKTWAVFAPFPIVVWLLLGVSIFICGGVLWYVGHYLAFNREKSFVGPLSYNLSCLQSIIGQDATLTMTNWPFRFIFISLSILGLFVKVMYSGILTAALIVPSYERPIDSFEDLVHASNTPFVMRQETSYDNLLKTATNGIYKQLYLKLIQSPKHYVLTEEDSYSLIVQGYASFGPQLSFELHFVQANRELFHLSREEYFPQYYGIAWNRVFEFKREFDEHSAKLLEAGIIQKWKSDEVDKVSLKHGTENSTNTSNRNDEGPRILTLSHLQGAFFLYLILMSLSIIAFAFEVGFSKFRK